MPKDPDDDQNLRARMAHIEDEFDRLAKTNQLLQGALANVPGPTRRQALSAAAIALGASAGGVGFLAGQDTARAAPTGQMGTAAEPIDVIYADEVGQSGDELTKVFTDSVEAGTVTAGGVSISGVSEGSTTEYLDAKTPTPGGAAHRTQQTDGVSTAAATILTFSANEEGALVTITGDEQGGNARFQDLVHFSRADSPVVVNSIETNTPAGRTYTRSAGQFQLAMASGTYDVAAASMSAVRASN